MKKVVFLAAVLAIASTSPAQLLKGDMLGLEGDLHGMVGIVWDSMYIWRGFAPFGNKSAVHVLADLNLFETGFGASLAGHRANASGYENDEQWDYTLYYQAGLFAGEPYATNYRLGFVYYNFPDGAAWRWDLEELHAILSWPNLLPVKGLCPTYVLVRMWPARSNSFVEGWNPGNNVSGFAHIFMLDYGFTVPGVLPDVPEQLIKLHSELVYNGGIHPKGGPMDHQWTNAVLGVSTDFNLGYNITLTPAIYHQIGMEVYLMGPTGEPDKNETWVSVGLKYTF
jgi:hypothetical protein